MAGLPVLREYRSFLRGFERCRDFPHPGLRAFQRRRQAKRTKNEQHPDRKGAHAVTKFTFWLLELSAVDVAEQKRQISVTEADRLTGPISRWRAASAKRREMDDASADEVLSFTHANEQKERGMTPPESSKGFRA